MFSRLSSCVFKNALVAKESGRVFCSSVPSIEKSLNQVTLLGRVGADPILKGTEKHPVVTFSLATNTNLKMESENYFKQKTEWHRISVFKPFLRDSVHSFVRKGNRVLVTGKIMYGEIVDGKGIQQQTTTIVADDVIFIQRKEEEEMADTKEASI